MKAIGFGILASIGVFILLAQFVSQELTDGELKLFLIICLLAGVAVTLITW